jgi:phage terminase small subunit
MTSKMKKFCLEYASSGNATQSAIKAGYAEKTAYSQGQRLLKNVEVNSYLQEIAEQMESSKIANAKEMQERLTSIIRMQTKEEAVVVEGIGEGYSEARTLEKNPNLKDVIKAIDTLARIQGVYDNKSTVNICIPVFGGEEDLEE